MDWLITTSAIYSQYIRNLEKRGKKREQCPKWWWEFIKKTEVEKSSSMPTCQHHDNGSDHNTNDKYKAPRRRQILKCIHLCVCVTRTYIRTYLLPTPPPAIHIPTGWVECHGPYKRGQGAPQPQSSRPPFLGWGEKKPFILFFKYFVPKYWEISLTEWGAGGMEGSMRKRYSSITVCSSQQQPAAEVQALGSDPWSLLAPPNM